MRRREVITALLVSAAMGRARAQQSAKPYRIAILSPATPMGVMNESTGPEYPLWRPLFMEMRRLGYVEGQNLVVERYSGRSDYSPDLARKVVTGRPDVIFCIGASSPTARTGSVISAAAFSRSAVAPFAIDEMLVLNAAMSSVTRLNAPESHFWWI